jgi:anthranilate synthase component 1
MKKIELSTTYKKLLADVFTPVGIYLRLRDRFRDTILLESSDFHAGENSFSIIGINAIAGIEISNAREIEYKLPSGNAQRIKMTGDTKVTDELWKFMQKFEITETVEMPAKKAQGLFGYTTFDAIPFFEDLKFKSSGAEELPEIPLVRYRLYQYAIVINHFKDELFICENHIKGIESEFEIVESLIKSKDVPSYPFAPLENET